MKAAVLNNGLHTEEAFKAFPEIDLLYVGSFNVQRIFLYDTVFIPFHLDQVFLYRHRRTLHRFLRDGGVLVLLGATEETRKWLPFFRWERDFTKTIKFSDDSNDGKVVFRSITSTKDLQFHSSYYGHGSLSGTGPIIPGKRVLAEDDSGHAVMVIKRSDIKGTLFVTTLDPDYHCTTPVPGPSNETVSATHEKADRLLRNIVGWATQEAAGKPELDRKHVRRRAWLKFLAFGVSTFALYSLPVWGVAAAFFLLNSPKSHPVLASVSTGASLLAVLGSAASLFSMYQTWRAERDR